MDVDNGFIGTIVSIAAHIQGTQGKIAIVVAIPAPIEMEQVVGVVTITNKSMASIVSRATIKNRATQIEIALHHGQPFRISMTVSEDFRQVIGIAEIVQQRRDNIGEQRS